MPRWYEISSPKGCSHSWPRMMVQYPSWMNNTNIISNINIKIIKRKGLEATQNKQQHSEIKQPFAQQSKGKKLLLFLYMER